MKISSGVLGIVLSLLQIGKKKKTVLVIVTVCWERIDEAIYHFKVDQSELLAQHKPVSKLTQKECIFHVAASPPHAALALQFPAAS